MIKRTRTISNTLIAAALLAGALVASAEEQGSNQDALREKAFSATRTHARRRALAHALGEGALVVLSSGRSTESDAVSHRANRNFLYLSGIEDPSCFIIINGETETLYAPPRNKTMEIWTGTHVYPGEETAQRYGFDKARPTTVFKEQLKAALETSPTKLYVDGFRPDELKDDSLWGGMKPEPCAITIGRLRQVKDEAELALLKRAAEISAVAHRHCTRALQPGRFEFEVQGLFDGACRFLGAEAQGYPSIVGSGPNSCVLHYDKNRRRMSSGDLVVLDAAGECGGYSADVTRTYPVSGKFTPEQRRVYEAVLEAQEAGIKACVPGKTVKEVGEASRAVLKARGLVEYLPHGVSHWLGLDVHDAGDYALPLAPGMVLTVEPGVYIAEKELGVRIEDDILVTEDGPVNLSGDMPRSPDEIEAILARAREGKLELPALPEERPLPALRRHKGRLY